MRRKDGLPKKHGGGRVRAVFCESCKIDPKPARTCKGCRSITWLKYKNKDRAAFNAKVSARYHSLPEEKKQVYKNQKQASRKRSVEVWVKYLEKERLRKSQIRYGEYAEAHLEFRKLVRQIKGSKNEESSD